MIITIEQGWFGKIKPKAIDRLILFLEEGKSSKQLFTCTEYADIYTCCYDMCTQRRPYNFAENLYEYHNDTISSYLREYVLPSFYKLQDEFLLREFYKRWENHILMNNWMRKFFIYLDRYYIKQNNKTALYESGIMSFKEIIYENVKIKLIRTILSMINKERKGLQIDQFLIKSSVEILILISDDKECYVEFEYHLLNDSREVYARQLQEWIISYSTTEYLQKVKKLFQDEKDRVRNYLKAETEYKLLQIVIEELLLKNEISLINNESSGLRALLINDKLDDILNMYHILSNSTSALDLMAIIFQEHIKSLGYAVIRKMGEETKCIEELIDLHHKYLMITSIQFDNNKKFINALNIAFKEFINHNVEEFKIPYLLSCFLDSFLKKGGEKLSHNMIEENIVKVVNLFAYLTDKDLFLEIYKNHLAKRLLTDKSASDEWEKMMITNFKMICGTSSTSKMEGMLHDINMDSLIEITSDECRVRVLTNSHWPKFINFDVILPVEIKRYVDIFSESYRSVNTNKKLIWQFYLGSAIIRSKFGSKTFDLSVSTLQAIVLLTFSSLSEEGIYEITLDDLQSRLNITVKYLKAIMHSLCCGKHKVLLKTPANNKISDTDTFVINDSFNSAKKTTTIPMPILEESHDPSKVIEDRTHSIEAAVVRIMKARKVLSHAELIAQVLSQLQLFNPEPRVVKSQIHSLIDREYLQRDDDNPQIYRYLA